MGRSNKPPRPSTTGVLVLDKPIGPSSMSAVAVVRRRAGGARTGHAGTLDPKASGVLVLALGKATKSIDRLMATDKAYETEIRLGATTATDDAEAELEHHVGRDVVPPDQAQIEASLDSFRGAIQQRPPAFSAIKVGGRRAYALARGGAPPELPARPVVVHDLELIRYEWPDLALRIRCGKGFYVRSLARDIGAALGVGGFCTAIRRTAVGPFTLAHSVSLDDVPEPLLEPDLIPLETALAMLVPPPSSCG